MFDKILSNKNFCIAILLILLVALYLYQRKKTCSVEGLHGMDNFFPISPDAKSMRTDNTFRHYQKRNRRIGRQMLDENIRHRRADKALRSEDSDTDIMPMPLDSRPELGNCVPCKPCKPCPQVSRCQSTGTETETDSETDSDFVPRYRYSSRSRRSQ